MSNIQIHDLDNNARLKITCTKCGSSYFLKPAEVIERTRAETPLYLDEVEAQQKCNQRGCKGQVRLMLLEGRNSP